MFLYYAHLLCSCAPLLNSSAMHSFSLHPCIVYSFFVYCVMYTCKVEIPPLIPPLPPIPPPCHEKETKQTHTLSFTYILPSFLNTPFNFLSNDPSPPLFLSLLTFESLSKIKEKKKKNNRSARITICITPRHLVLYKQASYANRYHPAPLLSFVYNIIKFETTTPFK